MRPFQLEETVDENKSNKLTHTLYKILHFDIYHLIITLSVVVPLIAWMTDNLPTHALQAMLTYTIIFNFVTVIDCMTRVLMSDVKNIGKIKLAIASLFCLAMLVTNLIIFISRFQSNNLNITLSKLCIFLRLILIFRVSSYFHDLIIVISKSMSGVLFLFGINVVVGLVYILIGMETLGEIAPKYGDRFMEEHYTFSSFEGSMEVLALVVTSGGWTGS